MSARAWLHAACLGAFALGGFPAPAPAAHVMWVDVCGRPGERMPIEIPGDGPREPCAKACHAVPCRKTASGAGDADDDDRPD